MGGRGKKRHKKRKILIGLATASQGEDKAKEKRTVKRLESCREHVGGRLNQVNSHSMTVAFYAVVTCFDILIGGRPDLTIERRQTLT